MDSLTQIVLGASVGEAALGRKIGNKAPLLGALAGTLPDLDVLAFPFWNDVQQLTLHRSATHSILVLIPIALLFGSLCARFMKDAEPADYRRLFLWAFLTHPLLDCFTTYGTQVFWPIWNEPVAWNVIFIIDPLYTLPLLLPLLLMMKRDREDPKRRRYVWFGLVISTSYLAVAGLHKLQADRAFRCRLEDRPAAVASLATIPTPFNIFLWRGLVKEGNRLEEGYYSLLAPGQEMTFVSLDHQPEFQELVSEEDGFRQLAAFSKGYFSLHQEENRLVYTDVRFGQKGYFVFRYDLGQIQDGQFQKEEVTKLPRPTPPPGLFEDLMKGIWQGK